MLERELREHRLPLHEKRSSLLTSPPVSPCGVKKMKLSINPGMRHSFWSSKPVVGRRRLGPEQKTRKSTYIDLAIVALRKSLYATGLRHILKCGKKAQAAFDKIVHDRTYRQFRAYVPGKMSESYPQFRGAHDVENFSWDMLLSQLTEHLPTLSAALNGSLAKNRYKEDKDDVENRSITKKMGLMFAIPLYNHYPTKFNFVQILNSIQMWRSGCSNKLFKCFNKLGICQSIRSMRGHIDKLVNESDAKLATWKSNVEQKFQKQAVTDLTLSTVLHDVTTDEQPDYTPSSREQEMSEVELLSQINSNDEKTNDKIDELGNGFALVWKKTHTMDRRSDHSLDNMNKVFIANAFAALNRIDFSHFENQQQKLPMEHIRLSSFLPSTEDCSLLRLRMKTLIARILVNHVKYFKEHCAKEVVEHIPHMYSEKAAIKSQLVSIGVIDENPSTTAGVSAIMKRLLPYVPRHADGSHAAVPTHGDCVAVKRMMDSLKARVADHSEDVSLKCLVPVPQEFHHRRVMLQGIFNDFYNEESVGERGTMYDFKNFFSHSNISKDVMNNFNDADNFVRFLTESHIVYLAMTLCDMTTIDDQLSTWKDTRPSEKLARFDKLCEAIVNEIWIHPSLSEIQGVLDCKADESVQGVYPDKWCICHKDKRDAMIRCSNTECSSGAWFHQKCLGLRKLPKGDKDWFCSEDCKSTRKSILCFCKSVKQDDMVTCKSGSTCINGRRFHKSCVYSFEASDNNWFCSTACQAEATQQQDGIKNYAVALTYYGLLDQCHKDAIREADGMALMSMWRVNMLRFWESNNRKYLTVGHRLLSGIAGCWPPRIVEEVIHNRTVNLRGGIGNNIAMDRVCEFLSADFKETLSSANGRHTDYKILRFSKIVGSIAKSLDAAYHESVCHNEEDQTSVTKEDYDRDIRSFVSEYRDHKLFTYIPGRQHASFPNVINKGVISDKTQLKARLANYSFKVSLLQQ